MFGECHLILLPIIILGGFPANLFPDSLIALSWCAHHYLVILNTLGKSCSPVNNEEANTILFLLRKKTRSSVDLLVCHGKISDSILSTFQHLPLILMAGWDVLSPALPVAPSVQCLPH